MRELAEEVKSYMGRSSWDAPVQGAHTFGGVTLFAAADHLRSYGSLFDADRAPVYGHLILARAIVEASVVSAWLNDASVIVEDRIRRALVERIHSARQQQRIKDMRPKGKQVENEMRTVAQAFGWDLRLGDSTTDIELDGIRWPSPGPEATKVLVDIAGSTLGQTLWSYQSGIMHSAWYALAQAVISPPEEVPGSLTPSRAGFGTDSRGVNAQTVCALRLVTNAARHRVELMGWQIPEWTAAVQRAEQLDDAIMRSIRSTA